jgi:hypothetical protein
MADTILVTGATGFIGRHLTARLLARGSRVIALSRDARRAARVLGPAARIVTNLTQIAADERIDAIVNLAGAPIASRPWTRRRKRTLLQSRITVTHALLDLAARLEQRPATWVTASAIGYYGVRTDDVPLHEKSPAQAVFQSELCAALEAAAARAGELGVKVAALRIGLVLGRDGGALPALARPVRRGLGMVLGSGAQWVSWIHVEDLLDLIVFVLAEKTLAGPLNATAPAPVRQRELMQAIAAVLERKLLPFALPAGGVRALLGELAQLFVDGQRVVPARATALGFTFRYATLDAALRDLLEPRRRYFAATVSSSAPGASGSATE